MTIMKHPKQALSVPVRKPGSAKGRVKIAADFDAPLDDFGDYR
jgi:hypothetical protein